VLAHHKVDTKGSNREKALAEALKRPVVRSDIAKVLRFRLDAWCETDPARQIQNQLDALQPLDSVYDIANPNYVKQHYPKDSLIHHASTNKRTIANMLVPSGIKPNSYKSPNGPRRPGLPEKIRSRDYVVYLALAMLDGSFDYAGADNLTQDYRYTDPLNRVVIHKAGIKQHRTTADLILYGEC
ncbi:MAG TPA: hypothetical protein VM124_03215, partial [Candidatus Limnocylindrales bacterium]|nr:hypothetical protein [Candidatus Limnocylindrales bacterium]